MTIILSIVSCFGLLLFAFTNPYLIYFGTFLPSNSHIEKLARIQFPDSATNITYKFEETGELVAPECTISLQFEMNPEDFETFSESTLIEDFEVVRLEHDDFFSNKMEDMSWLQPENSIAGYGYVPCCSPEIQQWIFIDSNDPDSWIVYVITNEYWLD